MLPYIKPQNQTRAQALTHARTHTLTLGRGLLAFALFIMVSLFSVSLAFGDTSNSTGDNLDTNLDRGVLEAFQRYSANKYPDVPSIQARLDSFYDDPKKGQVRGVVSNVKGILHELEFVWAENSDGDAITAELFGSTSQPCFDVIMTDGRTGQQWFVQLKARRSPMDVARWQARCGAVREQLFVTQELARREGLQSSGFSNEALTARVEAFIDRLMPRGYYAYAER